MQISRSTGFRNAVLVTGSVTGVLAGAVLKVYSGTMPASADAALSGNTLLCTYSGDGVPSAGLEWEATPISGALLKKASQAWSGNAVSSGTATFFRLEMPADTGASSTSAVRIQGDVALANALLNLTNGVTFASGAPQAIQSFVLSLP